MQLFVEQVLNGIANGVVYGSVALALVLIFRTTGVLNFAQGRWRCSPPSSPGS